MNHILSLHSLQLFAEDTGETGAAAVPQTPGVTLPAAGGDNPPDQGADFDTLIQGRYKQDFDRKVQTIVQRRLKGTHDQLSAQQPILELVARKYGVADPGDLSALSRCLEADVPGANARENASRLYQSWIRQAGEIQSLYPGFDLHAEMANPKFLGLLRSDIDMRTAYEVLHRDEIFPAAMAYTAKTVEQKIADSVASNQYRPTENGNSGQGAVTVRQDVSKLTRADRQEIARRAARGETIRF